MTNDLAAVGEALPWDLQPGAAFEVLVVRAEFASVVAERGHGETGRDATGGRSGVGDRGSAATLGQGDRRSAPPSAGRYAGHDTVYRAVGEQGRIWWVLDECRVVPAFLLEVALVSGEVAVSDMIPIPDVIQVRWLGKRAAGCARLAVGGGWWWWCCCCCCSCSCCLMKYVINFAFAFSRFASSPTQGVDLGPIERDVNRLHACLDGEAQAEAGLLAAVADPVDLAIAAYRRQQRERAAAGLLPIQPPAADTLTVLDVSHQGLVDSSALGTLPCLAVLVANHNRLTGSALAAGVERGPDEGKAAPVRFPVLTHLDLAFNRVSSLAWLSDCPRLAHLDLAFNGLRGVADLVRAVRHLTPGLEWLSVVGNSQLNADPLGVARLVTEIPTLRVLNGVDAEAAECLPPFWMQSSTDRDRNRAHGQLTTALMRDRAVARADAVVDLEDLWGAIGGGGGRTDVGDDVERWRRTMAGLRLAGCSLRRLAPGRMALAGGLRVLDLSHNDLARLDGLGMRGANRCGCAVGWRMGKRGGGVHNVIGCRLFGGGG